MQGLWQEFIRIFTASFHKDLYKTLVKVCVYDGPLKLHHETWNSCKIGIEEHSRDLKKISLPESQLRESAKVSTAPQRDDSKIGPAPQQERSDRRQVPSHHPTRTKCQKACMPRGWRAISKFARRHNESDPTRAKCREGCASDIKIRTAPPSNTHKVPRGLRSAERVASDFSPCPNESYPTRPDVTRGLRELVRFFTQHCAHHETWRLKMYENVKSSQKRCFT